MFNGGKIIKNVRIEQIYLDKSVVELHFYLDKSVVGIHFYLDKSVNREENRKKSPYPKIGVWTRKRIFDCLTNSFAFSEIRGVQFDSIIVLFLYIQKL